MAPRLSPFVYPSAPAAPRPFNQKDWLLTTTSIYQPVTLRTWTWQYNQNLIAQDRLPVGEIITDRPSRQKQRLQPSNLTTWTWQYNLNLIGQDQFPSGEASTALTVKPYEYHVQLRTWNWNYNLNLIGKDQLPSGEIIGDLTPRAYPEPATRTWVWSYNLNLVGKDQLPVGEISTALTVKPYEYHVQLRSWAWNYNLNLIGKDQLPTGEIITDRPSLAPALLQTWSSVASLALTTVVGAPFSQDDWPNPVGFAYPVGLRTWSQPVITAVAVAYKPATVLDWGTPISTPAGQQTWISPVNLALTTTVAAPFTQDDWPNPLRVTYPVGLTASFNLNLIGQDKLPTGEAISDLPPRAPLQPIPILVVSYNQNLIGQDKLPTGEFITDLPPRAPQQPTPIFAASYNKNLIGKDQLPNGEAITDRPPLAPLSSIQLLTWIQSVNLALITQAATLPFNQDNWPINTGPQQPIQVFTASFNKNLIGQDKLPFRQQDWPLPTPRPRSLDLVTWIDRAKSYLQKPTFQTDWPIPRAPQQPIQTFTASFNRNLIGKDRLPFRQQDWPLPRDVRQPDNHSFREFVSSLNLALNFPPFTGQLPRNQYSWPLPQQPAPLWQRYSYEYQGGSLLPIYVSPIPPVPPPTPPEDNRIAYNAGNEWQMLDRIKEPGPVGWR
jgi:hypothetical protein